MFTSHIFKDSALFRRGFEDSFRRIEQESHYKGNGGNGNSLTAPKSKQYSLVG